MDGSKKLITALLANLIFNSLETIPSLFPIPSACTIHSTGLFEETEITSNDKLDFCIIASVLETGLIVQLRYLFPAFSGVIDAKTSIDSPGSTVVFDGFKTTDCINTSFSP